MFNNFGGNDGQSSPLADNDPFGFSNSSWGRFGMAPSGAAASAQQQHQGLGASSSSSAQAYQRPTHLELFASSGMDWTPTTHFKQEPDVQPPYQHHQQFPSDHGYAGTGMPQDVPLDEMSSGQNSGGVGRLVAQFENKGYVPPLPPRPINQAASSTMATSPNTAQYSSLGTIATSLGHQVSSPVHSPHDSYFGSFDANSRIDSPPPISYGHFHQTSRVSSPMGGQSSGPFGSLDDFMSTERVQSPMAPTPMASGHFNPNPAAQNPVPQSPMVTSPMQTSTGVGGTPGFDIWRPPPSITIKQEYPLQQPTSRATNSAGFAKPPVPTTPKPVMNAGSQFILELNPAAKAKGKAPAKPPRPRATPAPSSSVASSADAFSHLGETKPSPFIAQTSDHATSSSSFPTPVADRPPLPPRTQSIARPSREQVPPESWEQYKSTIRALYLEERKPLKEVMAIMAEKFDFQATPKMYKTRFSQWGFVKNNTEDEVKKLLSMKFQRDAEGKVSEFVRNGKVVNLGTYLKRKGVTEYDLVDFELSSDLPSHIRCRTPTPPLVPGYLQSPDLIRAQELVVGNMRKAFLHCRQSEVDTNAQVAWPTIMVWGASSSDLFLQANFYFEARDVDQGGQLLMQAFGMLEADLKKLNPQGIQELLMGMVHRDTGVATALCKYLAAYSTNFDKTHPLRLIFTCLYEVQQKHGSATLSDLLWGSMPTIAEELEAIYGPRHPYVARTWLDLAIFHDHADRERMVKLVAEVRASQRSVEQQHGGGSADAIAIRYAILQLLYSTNPKSDVTKRAADDLWNDIRKMNMAFPVRDNRPNSFCYHSPLKVDPWTKRCRRRYDSGVAILEDLVGVKVYPYFEEDFHTMHHELESQDSWAAAMQQMQTTKWSLF